MAIPGIAIKANIRREKKQIFVLIILFMIAVFMMISGLMLLHSFGAVFADKCEMYHAPDVYVVMKENIYQDTQKKWLEEQAAVTEIETLDVLYLENATIDYHDTEMQLDVILFSDQQKRDLNQYQIVDKSETVTDGIYIGIDFRNNGGYAVGDELTFQYLGKEYVYPIAGFIEDIYNGFVRNQMNTGIIMPEHLYEKLREQLSAETGDGMNGIVLQAALQDRTDSAKLLDEFLNEANFSGDAEYTAISYNEASAYFDQKISIVAAILLAFSILMTLVVMLVIYFEIVDYYQTNIKNIGIMKAVGYTSGQLILVQICQFLIISLTACLLGTVSCLVLYPFLADMVVSSTWLEYTVDFSLSDILAVFLVQIGLTALITYLTNIRVKRMYPTEAMELGGNFGKKIVRNPYDMRKHRVSLNVMMAIKTFFRNMGLNVFIVIVIAAVTFAMGFILTLNYNIGYKPENIVNMLMYEYPDVQFLMNPYQYDETILEELEKKDDVERAIFFDIKSIKCNTSTVYVYVTEDFSVTRNNIIYEGRHPETDYEIAVGGMLAESFGKEIGDTIVMKSGDRSQSYQITGLIQTSVGGGFDCELVTAAYEKLNPDYQPFTGYLYLSDTNQAKNVIDMLEEDYEEKIFSITNQVEMIDASMSSYISLIQMITVLFSILTLVTILIIMYITIKKIIFRQQRSFGIQKAVGFTSKDLMSEMSLATLPILLVGTVIGVLCTIFLFNPLCTAIFSTMGIMKVQFTIQILWLCVMGVLILMASYLALLFFLGKIRKLSAYKILLEKR